MVNVWQLYETMPGWQTVASLLTETTRVALYRADHDVTKGVAPERAAMQAFCTVFEVMTRPGISAFGAADTEPRGHLSYLIETHFQTRYGLDVYV